MNEEISESTYKEIRAFALSRMAKLKNANHNDVHITHVENNANSIVKILGVEKIVDRNVLQVACLLHDLTYTAKKPSIYTYIFEGHIVRKIVREVLEKFSIPEKSKEIIVEAVYHHAHSFPFRRLNKNHDIYSKILQDADTLDFFDCLRLKMYIKEHDKGIFRNQRKFISSKMVEYGVNNLDKFLNYPMLAKSFFVENGAKCLI